MFGTMKNWTLRGIVSFLRSSEITETVMSKWGNGQQAKRKFLGRYQQEASKLIETLTARERKSYKDLATVGVALGVRYNDPESEWCHCTTHTPYLAGHCYFMQEPVLSA